MDFGKMKKLKIIKIKEIPIHLNLDIDHDGHLDYKDCQPFNKHKHGPIPPEIQQDEESYYLEEKKRKKR